MTDTMIARRYAQALFLIGEEKNQTDHFMFQLDEISEVACKNKELADVLNSRLIAPEKKHALLSQLFFGKIDQVVLNFLFVILDKGRESALPAIISEYRAFTDEKNGVVCVRVQSAAVLSEEQLQAVKAAVKTQTGKESRIETEIDETLIGGVKVIIGDLIYDASVSGQLSALKEQLLR